MIWRKELGNNLKVRTELVGFETIGEDASNFERRVSVDGGGARFVIRKTGDLIEIGDGEHFVHGQISEPTTIDSTTAYVCVFEHDPILPIHVVLIEQKFSKNVWIELIFDREELIYFFDDLITRQFDSQAKARVGAAA